MVTTGIASTNQDRLVSTLVLEGKMKATTRKKKMQDSIKRIRKKYKKREREKEGEGVSKRSKPKK